MWQPVVFNFPVNHLNLWVCCGHGGVRLKTPPVHVPQHLPLQGSTDPREGALGQTLRAEGRLVGPCSCPWIPSAMEGGNLLFSTSGKIWSHGETHASMRYYRNAKCFRIWCLECQESLCRVRAFSVEGWLVLGVCLTCPASPRPD